MLCCECEFGKDLLPYEKLQKAYFIINGKWKDNKNATCEPESYPATHYTTI